MATAITTVATEMTGSTTNSTNGMVQTTHGKAARRQRESEGLTRH